MYAGRRRRARRRSTTSSTSRRHPYTRRPAGVAARASGSERLTPDPRRAAEHAAPAVAAARSAPRCPHAMPTCAPRACPSCAPFGRPGDGMRPRRGARRRTRACSDADRRRTATSAGPRGHTTSSRSSPSRRSQGIRVGRSGRCRPCRGVSFTVDAGRDARPGRGAGSGKSTVGRCVLRLIEPTSGSVSTRAASCTGARRRRAAPSCAARCRSSSRTRTRRSTRA